MKLIVLLFQEFLFVKIRRIESKLRLGRKKILRKGNIFAEIVIQIFNVIILRCEYEAHSSFISRILFVKIRIKVEVRSKENVTKREYFCRNSSNF